MFHQTHPYLMTLHCHPHRNFHLSFSTSFTHQHKYRHFLSLSNRRILNSREDLDPTEYCAMIMTNKNREERKRCMGTLKLFFKKLHTGFSLSPLRKSNLNDVEEWETVPGDVKEGHFAVFAAEDGEQERFIVELGCLSSPAFMSLLNQAEEEYGFEQKGAIVLPCRPQELQKILMERRKKNAAASREWTPPYVKIIECC